MNTSAEQDPLRGAEIDPLDLIDRPQVLGLLAEHLSSAWASFERPRPADPDLAEDLRERLGEALPELPGDAEASLDDAAAVLDASVSPSRPLFAAFIGSTGVEAGVLAAALSSAYDVNLAAAAGAAELIELQALRWMAEFIGYPLAEGTFTSGGMSSNLTALIAARSRALPDSRRLGVTGRPAAIYCSAEAHYSVIRAAEVAGLGSEAVRKIPQDERRKLRVDLLEAAIVSDLEVGIAPVAVIATAGTTLTGTVDPLAQVAEVCERHNVWFHVDGAYGAPAAAVDSARELFKGIERADSVTIDAHKWMGMQKSCSLVMMGRSRSLVPAFAHNEQYMLHAANVSNAVDSTLEYSRPVRALKLWLAFRIYGAAAFRRWISGTITHACTLAGLIREDPSFELLNEPELSTVCLRHLGDGQRAVADLDAHNLALADAIRADGRVYLAPATVDGKVCLRVCFTNFRTKHEHVLECKRVISEIAASVP